ncbi:MAG TPA: tetratricopeptide repeat protein, partial [Chitinophagaceae bacterium]
MTKFILSSFLACLLLFCFSQDNPGSNSLSILKAYSNADEIYRRAERLSLQAGNDDSLQAKADEVYREALVGFNNLVPGIEKTGNDSLHFFVRMKTGFIEFYFDSINAAKKDYLATIALKQRLPAVPDSFLFIPLLYTGGIYYTQNQFDSALFFYKKAETVNDNYKKPLTGSERLYNRLGVMYFENGNYRQARNYFEKAITLTKPTDTSLLVNYKVNIASLLVKLEEYPKAQTVYESLLSYHVLPDEINHNLGIISLKLDDYKKAITYLRNVNYTGSRKSIDLYYNFGVAWSGLHEDDSSTYYIQKAIAENTKWNDHKKNTAFGLILNFQARELMNLHKYNQAIELYQEAIMQFDPGFNEPDILKNPEEFSAVFSYINLFNTLIAKADALELLYKEQQDIKFLELSFDAYRSAFKLADYVEKTYDSDEARLFLGKIKYTAHSKPIDVSLLLYDLTQKREYLEEAYHFDQQNKASVLTLNVQENELKNKNTLYKELFEKEASLKSAITRLSLKSAQLTDSLQLQLVNSTIRDHEIQLGKLQEKMNEDPGFRSRYFTSRVPSINELQKKLD